MRDSRVRDILKPSLELLAGIPTIVYGFFAVTFIRPDLLKPIFPGIGPFSALAAGIAVGIMTIPLVASLSEDAMRAVPRALREGGYALGATKLEVSWQIVVPAALSGIIASFILAMSRAVGETMIVALAAGSKPQLTANPARADADDDRVHRPGLLRRHGGRHRRRICPSSPSGCCSFS